MVFAKGRTPKARRREAVITAAKLRCLFSVRRSCHGLRTFLHTDGRSPVPESAASLPGNGGRIMRAAERTASAARKSSTTNTKSLDQLLVPRIVGAPEIIQNLASLRHKLQQPAPRVIVFDMCLEVFRQIIDPIRQEGNLHLGRTGIVRFDGIRLDKLRFTRGCYRHRHQPLSLCRHDQRCRLN